MSTTCPGCGGAAGHGRFCGRCGAHLGRAEGTTGRAAAAGRRPVRSAVRVDDPREAGRDEPSPARGPLTSLGALLVVGLAMGALVLWADEGDPAGDEVDLPSPEDDPERATAPDVHDAGAGTARDHDPDLVCLGDEDCERWRLPLRGEAVLGVDATPDEVLIFGSATARPAATHLDALTPRGEAVWHSDDLEPGEGTPPRPGGLVVADDLVLVSAAGGRVGAMEAATGAVRWEADGFEPDHAVVDDAEVIGDTAVLHLRVPWTGNGGTPTTVLTAVDARTGAQRWSTGGEDATVGHGVVTLVTDGELHRLDPDSGEELWSRRLADRDGDDDPAARVALRGRVGHLDGATLVVPGRDRDRDPSPRTQLIAAEDGHAIATLDGEVVADPAEGAPLILEAREHRELAAYDATGATVWARPAGVDGHCCADVLRHGDTLVLAGTDDRRRYEVVDATDGGVRHEGELAVGGRLVALLGPTTLGIVADDDPATLTAVDAGDGRPRWRAEQTGVRAGLVEGLALVPLGGELAAAGAP